MNTRPEISPVLAPGAARSASPCSALVLPSVAAVPLAPLALAVGLLYGAAVGRRRGRGAVRWRSVRRSGAITVQLFAARSSGELLPLYSYILLGALAAGNTVRARCGDGGYERKRREAKRKSRAARQLA